MGKVNIKLSLGTGEPQQRRGHSSLRLGCSTYGLLGSRFSWVPSLLLCMCGWQEDTYHRTLSCGGNL